MLCDEVLEVDRSRGSTPANAESKMAASVTVRAIGPAVSCDGEIGIMPSRLINPTVGFIPTKLPKEDGETIEPSVSVPTAIVAKLAAIAAADPELEPLQFR